MDLMVEYKTQQQGALGKSTDNSSPAPRPPSFHHTDPKFLWKNAKEFIFQIDSLYQSVLTPSNQKDTFKDEMLPTNKKVEDTCK